MRLYLVRTFVSLLLLASALFVVFALTSRPLDPHPYFAEGEFLVIAHRGGRGLAPENTLAAFAHSTELGVDVLEMDLRQSRDGVPIILHDPTVDRTTDGQGRADSLTLIQLQALDAAYAFSPDKSTYPLRGQGVQIPTLEQVFTTFPQMRFLIEIKDDSDALARIFCQTIRRFNMGQRVIAASFRDGPLETFRQACPEVATAAPTRKGIAFTLLHWLRLDAAFHPEDAAFQVPEHLGKIRVVDRRFVERAHAHRTQVHVWTINDNKTMRDLIELGVDGLITDYPGRLLHILGRPSQEETP
jgi:glycerophosphoryl diester phosphodiesterase